MRFRLGRRAEEDAGSVRTLAPHDADGALELAATLTRDGRVFDAIEMLSAANRVSRDPRVETQLLELRYDAMSQIAWDRERPSWPSDVEDLFPGVEGIPEVPAADLSAETIRSGIEHHGSLLVRGLVQGERVAQLVADIDRVFAGYDARARGAAAEETAPWFAPFAQYPDWIARRWARDGGGVLTVDSPPAMFDVIEAFEESGLGEVVGDYLGERPVLLAKKWTLRRVPHDAGVADWHQDGAFMGRDIRALNVWLSLSHCGDDAPGIDVVSRRLDDIAPTGVEGARLNWTVGPGTVERLAAGRVVRPIFGPGDALLFDHMMLHRTAVDAGMTRDRYAIESWFLAPSTYGSMKAGGDKDDPTRPRDQLPVVY